MQNTFQSFLLTGSLGLAILGAGTTAMIQTDFAAAERSLVGGSYQREIEGRFEQSLPLRQLSVHAWNALKFGLLGQPNTGAYLGQSGYLFTTEELKAPAPGYAFEAEVAAAKLHLDGLGIRLVPVIVPDKARIYSSDLPFNRSAALNQRYPGSLERLVQMDLPAIDLASGLTRLNSRVQTFMKTDTHWSPAGARFAASAIATHLADVELERSEFSTTKGLNEQFQGDLARFAETGPFRDYLGPERETITRYETRSLAPADDLFGDIEVPVALVGTSFSDRREFHFEGFLKQSTGLDLINFAQSGRGPFKPMREFLASEALKNSPPKIVIWEIPERYISPKDLS